MLKERNKIISVINLDLLINEINEIHNTNVNQKYAKILPYSFHLDSVRKFGIKFHNLMPKEINSNEVLLACQGHDLIEDARMTFNDVAELTNENVAEMIYACTELRGKDRSERHGKEYIEGLKNNKGGLFVKLCDLMANISFSLATNSNMYNKYKVEFVHFKEELYLEEYNDMFEFIDKLLNVK
jgi:(p)ppGpp synthase/HD superfamily hydrolase